MEYLRRHVDDLLDELITPLTAIALEGPKGCGKTETARRRADVVYSLDDPTLAEEVRQDPKLITRGEGVILVDEWQRVPSVWDVIRKAVDAGSPNTFILAGSAMPPAGAPIHSGAGRIVALRMRPLSFPERQVHPATVSLRELLRGQTAVDGASPLTAEDYEHEAARSGFPGIRPLPDVARDVVLDAYVDRIVQRELLDAGVGVRRPDALLAWLRAYAAVSGTTTSYTAIMEAATPGQRNAMDSKTARTYRTALQLLFILEPVAGWRPTNNPLKRLSQSPKHFLCDAGLMASLVGYPVKSQDGTPGAHAGTLFETLVASTLASLCDTQRAALRHVRTHAGEHEVDFIIERRDGRVFGVEVKRTAQVSPGSVRHLAWLQDQLGDRWIGGAVITTGKNAYTRKDGIHVIPLALLN